MHLLVNIKNKDVPLAFKMLKSLKSKVSITPVDTNNIKLIKDLEASMKEAGDIESGKTKGIPAEQGIHELQRSLDKKVQQAG